MTQQAVKLAPLVIGATLLLGMLILFNLDNAAIHSRLVSLSLLPKPEKLTELYFDANEKLPKSINKNQTISFSFVIHNLETTDYQYVYSVVVKSQDASRIVDRGTILLKNGQYYVKAEKFKLEDASKDQEVVIELTNKGQSIDFWLRRN